MLRAVWHGAIINPPDRELEPLSYPPSPKPCDIALSHPRHEGYVDLGRWAWILCFAHDLFRELTWRERVLAGRVDLRRVKRERAVGRSSERVGAPFPVRRNGLHGRKPRALRIA